ncbi:MAG: MarR family winged helix-turn-helix transcriptional regulator [Candidatus Thorarchaeota archaeon]|jgi:DNA-binding MarR family transcriptional regulator
MPKPEEEIANTFLLELVGIVRHISNVTHEEIQIGNGIFILNVIDSRPQCIMSDIVDTLNIGASTATRQLDTLVRQGLVSRTTADTDRRKVFLTLTDSGNQVFKRFKNHVTRVMRISLETYSEKEISRAIEVFHTIVKHSEDNLPLK